MRKVALGAFTAVLVYAVLELVAFVALAISGGSVPSLSALSQTRRVLLGELEDSRATASLAGDDVGPVGNQFELNPYFGFSFQPEPGFNEWGFFGEPPPAADGSHAAVVAITGGSLAYGFCRYGGRGVLRPYLKTIPRFRGRPVRVICMAVSGHRQPQQLYAVLEQLLLVHPIDMVIDISGFNEITAPVNNAIRGIHPAYPASNFWLPLTQGLASPEYMRRVGHLTWLRDLRRTLAAGAERLRHSVTANAFWSLGDRFLKQRTAAAQVALDRTEEQDRRTLPHFRSGPRQAFDEDQARRMGIAVWAESSREFQRLGQSRGFEFFLFLQPNQYVEPSTKVFTEEEQAIFAGAWVPLIGQVRAGYPLLIETGSQLAQEGIAFYDLTPVFQDERASTYIDACCHLNPHGIQLLARDIGSRIARHAGVADADLPAALELRRQPGRPSPGARHAAPRVVHPRRARSATIPRILRGETALPPRAQAGHHLHSKRGFVSMGGCDAEAGCGDQRAIHAHSCHSSMAGSTCTIGDSGPVEAAETADLGRNASASMAHDEPLERLRYARRATTLAWTASHAGNTPMASERHDLTTPPDLSQKRATGSERTRRPIYVDLLPPCNDACPAGENIQAWLAHAQAGRLREAWETILDDNPLPAVHGRVCYHPCESACNRAQLDTTVSIHAVERFLGDRAVLEGWVPRPLAPPSGKRVLVVGAGPSGLSAAYHLARLGHAVEVRDSGPRAGGMMRFGIPAYRLQRDVLDAEIARIAAMGVAFTLNHRVQDLAAEQREGRFDAVFVAVGAHLSKRTEIPARDAGKILDAVKFLRDVESGTPPRLGRRVAVYGGGNTAMDAARTVLRLGHEPIIVYRRDRSHMPAHGFEADAAAEEGVVIHWLRTIQSIEGPEMKVEEMELDADGRPHGTGRFETLTADDVILALGQDTDTSFLRGIPDIVFARDGTVTVSSDLMTGHPGIFAGGDMVPSERTVTVAVGHGKKAARHIDAYLCGTSYEKRPKPEVATYDKLHLWFFTDARQRAEQGSRLGPRLYSFDEVVHGLEPEEAIFEAARCLSCGNCYECDGCLAACPETAVVKLGAGSRYRFDYDRCTGCTICFDQCPCHAIEMIPEPAHGDGNGS